MTTETLDGLLAADTALTAMIAKATGFHPDHALAGRATEMVLALQMARLFVLDYAHAIKEGQDEEAALFTAIGGEQPFPKDAAAAFVSAQRRSLN